MTPLRALPPAALLACAAFAGCAARQQAATLPAIATDRPDFTESASVVPRGHLQLEAGYTFTRDDEGGRIRSEHGYPEALLRVGVADRVEARLGQSVVAARTAPGMGEPPPRRAGAEDFYLGAKVHLIEERGARPTVVVIAQATLPTGSTGLTAGRALPGINWIYAWDVVPGLLSLTASTQGNLAVDPADRTYLELTQSVSAGFALSERVGAYGEWYGSFPAQGRSGVSAAHTLNGGVTVRLTPGLQWDIRVGAGLTRAADGLFAGSGIAARY